MNRHMAAIKESGPGSVPDLGRQLMSKRIAVSIIRKDLDNYEVKTNHVKSCRSIIDKCDETNVSSQKLFNSSSAETHSKCFQYCCVYLVT